ncbi:MAG: NAD(+)/NADH kinase [Myxococcales bacterium]|nr:NAD(+)/NADH kinase [Myxococcales bacterium]
MDKSRDIRRIGLLTKHDGADDPAFVRRFIEWCEERGIGVKVPAETALAIGVEGGVPRAEIVEDVDALVVLGGDGTLLAGARLAGGRDLPVLGANMGRLGFLTEVTLAELHSVVEAMRVGDYTLSPRMSLEVRVLRGGAVVESHRVLNEAVMNKGALARMLEVDVLVNDGEVTSLRGDGLIVATPTGSTAYALSAGGPVVHPAIRCILVVPICAFTLTNRPIIVPDTEVVRARIVMGDDVVLTLDGQVGVRLGAGDLVEVRRAKADVQLIVSPTRSFYQVIREKLKWGS